MNCRMVANSKRVCIVGAGASGLNAIKECLQKGFLPVAFEVDSDIGGLWQRAEDDEPVIKPMVYDTLITNSHKYNMCFGDFPPLEDEPPYLPWKAVRRYLEAYAKHFDLKKYIQFNVKVTQIRRAPSYDLTGQWEITFCAVNATGDAVGSTQTEIFDYVIMCNGYCRFPNYPKNIKGMDSFPGFQQHSMTYRNNEGLRHKNVLVVGNKLSALDIGNDIANVAEQTYLAVGQGTWIIPRVLSNGCITELAITRKALYSSPSLEMFYNDFMIREASIKLDHNSSAIRPDSLPYNSPFGLQDDLQLKILSGHVKMYGYVQEIRGNKAITTDGRTIPDIDAIVYCTGYNADYCIIDDKIFPEDGGPDLYLMTFPVDLPHNTLAFIGQFGGDGSMFPISELQNRFVTRVFAGDQQLPPRKVMKKDAEFWNSISLERKGNMRAYVIPFFYLMEKLAKVIGVYPHFWKIFFKDPKLAMRTYYGPWLPSHYRLLGPDNLWDLARQTSHQSYEEAFSRCILRHKPEAKPLVRHDLQRIKRKKMLHGAAVIGLLSVILGVMATFRPSTYCTWSR